METHAEVGGPVGEHETRPITAAHQSMKEVDVIALPFILIPEKR